MEVWVQFHCLAAMEEWAQLLWLVKPGSALGRSAIEEGNISPRLASVEEGPSFQAWQLWMRRYSLTITTLGRLAVEEGAQYHWPATEGLAGPGDACHGRGSTISLAWQQWNIGHIFPSLATQGLVGPGKICCGRLGASSLIWHPIAWPAQGGQLWKYGRSSLAWLSRASPALGRLVVEEGGTVSLAWIPSVWLTQGRLALEERGACPQA